MSDRIFTIVLIGAGHLGSRHLQGLVNINVPVLIDVVDPSDESLESARKRFHEMPANPDIHGVRFLNRIENIQNNVDLAIIATNADVRASVVRSLLSGRQVDHLLLEKVLFQKETDYKEMGDLFCAKNVKAYVNCPRRIYPLYQDVRSRLAGKGPITFVLEGPHWNLGSNAIHLLDLFAFLTGEPDISIREAFLDKEILESKRQGFVEFTGTLTGESKNDNRFSISSLKNSDIPETLTIQTDVMKISINETVKSVFYAFKERNWEPEEMTFEIPYQSQLTGTIAREILLSGTCGLTPYEESARLHLPLLSVLITHLRNVTGKQFPSCPIT
ncbi:MAG TPA: Gfo/Idh/MocA family oxidoreductase [Saprospiraceae bacterium]|nr:Gfo/Idh/MocA family oxidoreductase [Saprospiraceae bacterium]